MNKYEILYIIDSSVAEEEREKVIASVSELVKANGGNAAEPEKWGVRKYAYPINYKNEKGILKKRPNRTPRNEKYSNLNKIKDWLIRSLSTVEELKRELVNWTASFRKLSRIPHS